MTPKSCHHDNVAVNTVSPTLIFTVSPTIFPGSGPQQGVAIPAPRGVPRLRIRTRVRIPILCPSTSGARPAIRTPSVFIGQHHHCLHSLIKRNHDRPPTHSLRGRAYTTLLTTKEIAIHPQMLTPQAPSLVVYSQRVWGPLITAYIQFLVCVYISSACCCVWPTYWARPLPCSTRNGIVLQLAG